VKVDDTLYAGTGSAGRLYQIRSGRDPEVVFAAPDRHVFALAADPTGGLYLGTYPRGKVYRYRDGRVTPVHELPSSTVTALTCDVQGNLYVGTSPRASVVKILPDGEVSTLFQSSEKHVLSLLADGRGGVWAAVGSPGRLYHIETDRTSRTVWDGKVSYVLALGRDDRGNLALTTAGPTQVLRLAARNDGRPEAAAGATYTSAVLDAGAPAKWGVTRWEGNGVYLQTRTGNTAFPDATWSDWSEPYVQVGGAPITSPPAQYLQYRAVFSPAGADAPATNLRHVEIFYLPRNRAPQITALAPRPAGLVSGGTSIRWTATDPDGDRLVFRLFYAREGSEEWVLLGTTGGAGEAGEKDTELPPAPVLDPTLLRTAPAVGRPRPADPAPAGAPGKPGRSLAAPPGASAAMQGGELVFPGDLLALFGDDEDGEEGISDVEVAGESEGAAASFRWNTRGIPDGRYRVRIVATDEGVKPDDPREATAITGVFVLDNTPPEIRVQAARRVGPAPPLEIPVRDLGSYISSAEYRVGDGPWIPATAGDGIFDSQEENVRLDPRKLPAGRHVLEVRVRDAAGNVATARVPYTLR
jgi:hypothetical protein